MRIQALFGMANPTLIGMTFTIIFFGVMFIIGTGLIKLGNRIEKNKRKRNGKSI